MATDLKDTAHPVDAAALMALLPTRPRLLAVGEPTHGEDALLHLRNDLFRQLVEQEGYRTIALETDCLAGLTVDAYVTSATGTLDTAMDHGFSHGWGACEANRDLVRWMRTHNENRPPSRQVRFAGFDAPLETAGAASPRQALTALHTHLAAHLDTRLLPCTATALDDLLGPDDRWSDPAAMYDPAASAGRTPRLRGQGIDPLGRQQPARLGRPPALHEVRGLADLRVRSVSPTVHSSANVRITRRPMPTCTL